MPPAGDAFSPFGNAGLDRLVNVNLALESRGVMVTTCNFRFLIRGFLAGALVMTMGLECRPAEDQDRSTPTLAPATADVAVESPTEAGLPSPEEERPLVYVLQIRDDIDPALFHSVKRGVDEALGEGADLIMVDMHTPGGMVTTSVKLKDLMINAAGKGADTATFVNSEAISGGALVALSCKKIYMAPGSTLGDIAPISVLSGDEEETPEKIVSYILGQVEAAAEENGYATPVVRAMVKKQLQVPGLNPEGELLVLTPKQALDWGISKGTVKTLGEAIEAAGYPNAEWRFVKENWAESIARFITSIPITVLLVALGVVAFGVEFHTPGIGWPAAIGVACFAIVFWGHAVAGLAGYGHAILFVVGLSLVIVELFVTPGFGLLGISGILLMAASLILALAANLPGDPFFDVADLAPSVVKVGSSFFLAIAVMVVLALVLPKVGAFHPLVLGSAQVKERGYGATEEGPKAYIGQTGIAQSDLRPAGVAQLGEKRLDVVTEGGHISRGSSICVVRVEGRRVVVKRV